MPRRPGEARAALLMRLRERRAEIEAAIHTRIRSDGAPTEAPDPEYGEGLRAAVPIALDYCLGAIERGESNPPPIPTALRAQACLAARNGIPLDTVLRRYFAGYTVLGDVAIEEVEAAGPRRGADLRRLLRVLAASFDRLLAAVSEDYARERASLSVSFQQRRVELVKRLLAGEPLDRSELDYDFDAHHLGLVAKGPEAEEALRELSRSLDRRLLSHSREDGAVWAWLGGKDEIDLEKLRRHLSTQWPRQIHLAVGEPGEGLGGWRLTHRQARAALPVALRSPDPFVRYADVALLAATFQDDLLATSLREMYLKPLERERDGGKTLRETLRAYFTCGRNVSSAASALGVNRHTVGDRLRAAEARLERPLSCCAAEFEAALRLEEMHAPPVRAKAQMLV